MEKSFPFLTEEFILYHLLDFLHYDEIRILSFCQKRSFQILNTPQTWKALLSIKIIPTQLVTIRESDKFLELLQAQSYKECFQSFCIDGVVATLPLVGLWRRIPDYCSGDHDGGLFSVHVEGNSLNMDKFNFSISSDSNFSHLYTIKCTSVSSKGALVLVCASDINARYITCLKNYLRITENVEGRTKNLIYFPVKLPPHVNYMETQSNIGIFYSVKHIIGFAIGIYSSHGTELLQVNISRGATSFNPEIGLGIDGICINEDVPNQEADYRLEGLKIQGDANVPGSRLSFSVDLSEELNIHTEVESDPRLIISYESERIDVVNMLARRPYISKIYRAVGQINGQQYNWRPEWVGAKFILYR